MREVAIKLSGFGKLAILYSGADRLVKLYLILSNKVSKSNLTFDQANDVYVARPPAVRAEQYVSNLCFLNTFFLEDLGRKLFLDLKGAITSAVRKSMLDTLVPGSFRNAEH